MCRFLFHIYGTDLESELLHFADKEFGMVYVVNHGFRWRGMLQVLRAIERVRIRVGRVALVGEGWGMSRIGCNGTTKTLRRSGLSEADRR